MYRVRILENKNDELDLGKRKVFKLILSLKEKLIVVIIMNKLVRIKVLGNQNKSL